MSEQHTTYHATDPKPEYYLMGRAAFHAWMNSRHFAQFDRDAPTIDVMRLFLPPVPQDMMQVARPLPKHNQEWLRGFDDARAYER